MSYTDTKLIALDPGKTTGVAIANYRRTHNDMEDKTWRLNLIETEQLDLDVEGLWRWLAIQAPSGIIYETFTYRRLPNADLTPVEIIGALKIYAHLHGIELWGSPPSNKVLWDNDKLLKLSGIYFIGRPFRDLEMKWLTLHKNGRLESYTVLGSRNPISLLRTFWCKVAYSRKFIVALQTTIYY